MFLSIVVLNFFASDKIKNLILSIKDQDFVGEVVIVDNSEDINEFNRLKENENVLKNNLCRVVDSGGNNGFSAGTNFGIKCISNEATHVYILNPDTVLMSDSLSYLFKIISDLPDIIISPRGIRMDSGTDWSFGGKLHLIRGRCDVDSKEKNFSVCSDFGTCASVIVPVLFLKKFGLLDEDFFLGGEEWELSIRMRRYGACILTPSKIIYKHEISGTHKKYGLPFLYMGHRTKVLFMRKCFPYFFPFWLIIYLISFPILIARYCKNNKLSFVASMFLSIKAVTRSISKKRITKNEFFSIGDVK